MITTGTNSTCFHRKVQNSQEKNRKENNYRNKEIKHSTINANGTFAPLNQNNHRKENSNLKIYIKSSLVLTSISNKEKHVNGYVRHKYKVHENNES